MSEPFPRISGIRQQFCRVDDPDKSTLVSSIAVNLAYAELWLVTRDGQARSIGRSDATVGKIDSAAPAYFPEDGTARLWVSAADVGGGGATSHTAYFDFPHVLGNWDTLDWHMKDRIYERVTTPATGTHQAIAAMDAAAVAPLQAEIDELKAAMG